MNRYKICKNIITQNDRYRKIKKKKKNKGILSKYDGDLESFICML